MLNPCPHRLKPLNPRDAHRRGGALLSTMLVVVFLASMALVFARQVDTGKDITRMQAGRDQARWIADGVTQAILADLAYSLSLSENPQLDFVEPDAGQLGEGLFWLLYAEQSDTVAGTAGAWPQQSFGLMPANRGVNLSVAAAALNTSDVLTRLPRMDSDLASVLLDWLDNDDLPGVTGQNANGGSGAEADVYLAQTNGYPAKNGALSTLQELFLLRGFDEEVVFGEDTNRNGVLDDHENDGAASPPVDNANGRLDRGLIDYVSLYGDLPNTDPGGRDQLIDLNANGSLADLNDFLAQTLGPQRGGQLLTQLVARRPYTSVLQVRTRLTDAELNDDEFAQIESRLTVAPLEPIRLNVYTATQAALAAAIGNQEIARKIISGRPAERGPSLAWLIDALGEQDAQEAAPHLTTRSYQFEADIVAVSGDGRGFVRRRVIFDTLDGQEIGTPRVVSVQDLTHLGWPLDPGILTALQNGTPTAEVATEFGNRIR